MECIYKKSDALLKKGNKYCPGCFHSMANKLVAECVEELELREKTTGIIAVGCANLSQLYFNFDMIGASHGRAAAVATGFKRMAKDRLVFCYQGDGDLASIGIAETIHAANRGERITIIFINNSTYGMTGGQMAPTTLVGQRSTTTPGGRNPDKVGFPIRMAEMIAGLEAPVFVARAALNNPKNVRKAKQIIKKAFEIQVAGKGYSFVELLSSCPTNWGMTPVDAAKWIDTHTMKYFPLGIFKDVDHVMEGGNK